MAMLADSVEVARRRRHPHRCRGGRGHRRGDRAGDVTATPAGYRQLLELAGQHHRQRVWAIEGTGGDGAGLTRFLHGHQEQVVELDRPRRAARRHGAESDPLDATGAAREALGPGQLAQPRATGPRAALSVRLTAHRSAVQAAGDANANGMPW
jgi:transposase